MLKKRGALVFATTSMPRRYYRACKKCGVSWEDGATISTRGLCDDCAISGQKLNITALRERRGPEYARWVRRTILAGQRRLVALERERV